MIQNATRRAVEAALAAGATGRAASIAAGALARGEEDPLLLNLVAWQREEAGDFAAAQGLIARAKALAPDDPLIRAAEGSLLRKLGRYAEAVQVFDAVLAATPGLDSAWLERGYALDALGSATAAAASYHRALAIDARCGPALAGLANAAARAGDRAGAWEFGRRALALDSTDVRALSAMIASDIAANEAERTIAPLHQILARSDVPPEDRIVALTLLGDAFDQLDAVDEAFGAYEAANRAFAAFHGPRMTAAGGQPSHLSFVERIEAGFMATAAADWSNVPSAPAVHIPLTFLLGYPRSGTTLTETVLAGIPDVSAIEEQPTLAEADRAFLLAPDGMARLARLDPSSAERYRAAYWAAASAAGMDGAAAMLVDMDPLKVLRLPIIAKLFPDARVLMIRRDPRDVIWSCFRRAFRVTAAAFEFTTLERAARHFAATMRFADRCRERLPLAVQDVRYAALVSSFDTTTQALCRFLDLPWSPELRRFDRTARAREIRTLSGPQVRRGLYDGGGQWRRYAGYLEPVLPIIEPWIARYGGPAQT